MRERLLFALALLAPACGGSSTSDAEHPAPPAASETTAPAAPPTPSTAKVEPAPPPASAAPSAEASAPPPAPAECPDGMVKVKGGNFVFGIMKKKTDVADACVDKTEVTADAYAECVKAGKCNDNFIHCGAGATYGTEGMGKHPIVCVDYAQASSYCEWKGQRLPTAEEWEWVARGGDDARKYAWGNDEPKDQACWAGSSKGVLQSSCDVGSFPAGDSSLGLSDLTGNVLEWTTSKADSSGTNLIACGGSWKDGVPSALAVEHPAGFKKEYRCSFLGIRCWTPPAK